MFLERTWLQIYRALGLTVLALGFPHFYAKAIFPYSLLCIHRVLQKAGFQFVGRTKIKMLGSKEGPKVENQDEMEKPRVGTIILRMGLCMTFHYVVIKKHVILWAAVYAVKGWCWLLDPGLCQALGRGPNELGERLW